MLKRKRNIILFRLFIIYFLSFTVQALHSQTIDLTRKVNVTFTDESLEKVLKSLSRTAKIQFSYSSKEIPADRKITFHAVDQPLEQVLNEIFQQAGIRYFIVSDYLVLKSKTAEEEEAENSKKPEMYTLSGIITDSASNEVLIGAAIYIKETGIGTLTNHYGFFSLTLPRGTYTFESSHLGYSLQKMKIDLIGNFRRNIKLDPQPVEMKEIVITSVNREEKIFHSPAAQNNLEAAEVQQHSAAMGETDMLKSLGNLPGISFQSDGSSYFFVRGGNRDQNLVLLDEAPVFNPSHMLGLFTPIIPEAVKHAEVYKADFPIQYGGRLSSVIDIRTRDGNMQQFSGSSGTSYISTRASIEGPFKKSTSSYFVSFRRSLFGYFIKKASPSVQDFYFSDFTSKFNIRLGQKDRLFITLYTGKDAYMNKPGQSTQGLQWGNHVLTLRWNHIFGSRLFTNTTFYSSKYDYSLFNNYEENQFWNSDITGTRLKSECTWYLNPRNRIKFGFSAGGYFFNPGNYNVESSGTESLKVSQVNSGELILYAGNEQEITPWLLLNYGVRITNWSNFGEAYRILYSESYEPIERKTYAKGEKFYSVTLPEPRASFSVKTGKYSSFKLSYNHNIQHINLINNSISPLNSLEVWLPSGPNIKPQRVHIFDAGFVKSWPKRSVDLYTDVYYKKMINSTGYVYHADMLLNPYIEGQIRQGKGRAYGFEVMLKKSFGKFTGQIGYSFSRSFLQINGLNGGREYPSHQDMPVDFSFSADYRITKRWMLSINTVYTSGMAVSTPTGFYYYRGSQVPVYNEQNNDRLPGYKRTDIGSVWRLNRTNRHFEHYLTFTVYNIFSDRNYALIYFNKISGADGKYYVPADKLKIPDQVVTYRYIYSMIPSLTYNLKF